MSSNIESISVIGLGYVGLPLALLAAQKGLSVTGIDIDEAKIKSLKSNQSYIDDVSNDELEYTTASFTSSVARASESDAVIICVPTPVTPDKQPDLGPVRGAVSAVTPHLKDGALLVIESTINPGVCDEIIIPLVEKISGKKVGRDILLAHCPERINPGDPTWNVSNINRVVGANSKKELKAALSLYLSIIDAEIKPMGSLKEAEAVKVVENSFRDINIAFVNELAKSFHAIGINIENVIDGAATKPFAFMPHRPGTGVGGHCIPVDPYYLIQYAHDHGFEHDFLRLARNINESMPSFTIDLLAEGLNKLAMPLKGTKVALLGLSYKPNVGDERESPAKILLRLLQDAEAEVKTFDPFIKTSTAKNLNESLDWADAVIIATGHDEFKSLSVNNYAKHKIKVVVDGRNIYKDQVDNFRTENILYYGIGVS